METHDLVVIGGGMLGCAVAYGLARGGHKCLVLDAPTALNKATRANVGLIWVQSKFLHLPHYARWAFISSGLFPDLVRELEEVTGEKIPVAFTGGIIPALGEEDYKKRAEYIEKLCEVLPTVGGRYTGAMISREELERKMPKIGWGPEVCGAAWCPDDGLVDPLALLRAFRVALPRVGGVYREATVYDVRPRDDGYLVETSGGSLHAGRVVLAAGLSNRRLARFALRRLPVYPDKGQVLLVERMPPVMPIPVLGVTQTFGGTTIVGFRHENAAHQARVTPHDVAQEGLWAMRVWPELGHKRVLRSWPGLRVMPEDKMAIYSRLPGHPNAYVLNTHSAVTMAAAHARLLPEFLLGGELPETARGMTLARFGIAC
ncbi:MAG: FAD-binding oxidoreductase [Desulfovibrio sp.]|nr:FAD-binding oxidoreductase [Desulfovibrio sp.]